MRKVIQAIEDVTAAITAAQSASELMLEARAVGDHQLALEMCELAEREQARAERRLQRLRRLRGALRDVPLAADEEAETIATLADHSTRLEQDVVPEPPEDAQ